MVVALWLQTESVKVRVKIPDSDALSAGFNAVLFGVKLRLASGLLLV